MSGDQHVYVVDTRDGTVGSIPAAEAEGALATGRFRAANAGEQQAARQTAEFGGRGGEVFGQGALNTLSFGALETERSRAIEAENQGAADLGSAAAGFALGGGTGGLLRGGAALGLGGRLAVGAAEGAVVAGAESRALSTERSLEDPSLSAESIMATLGGSMLLGGVLGGGIELGFAGAGRVGRAVAQRGRRQLRATRDAMGRMVTRATGQPALPGVAEALLERVGRAGTTGLDDASASMIQRGLAPTAEGRALREVLERGDGVIDDVLTPLRDQIGDLQQINRLMAREAGGQLKRGHIRRMVSEDAIGDAAEELGEFVAHVRNRAGALREAPGATGAVAMAGRLEQIADAAEGQVANAIQTGGRDGATDAFIALDELKRRFGREVVRTRRSMTLRDLAPEMEEAYEVGRRFLEREDLFGGAAVAQREINERWHRLIGTQGAFRRRFLTDTGVRDGFDKVLSADPTRLNSWLRKTGTSLGQADDNIFDNLLQQSSDFNDAVRRHYDLPAHIARGHDASEAAIAAMRQSRDRIRNSVAARNQFNEVSESLAARDSILGGAAGALGVVGGVTFGGAGAAAGLGLSALLNAARRPDRLVMMRAHVERMTESFRSRVRREGARFVDVMTKPRLRPGIARDAIVALSAAEVGERFNATVATVAQNGDPEAMVARLEERTRDLSEAAEETSAMLMAAGVRAQMYLAGVMPPLAQQAPPMLGAPQTQPSERVTEHEQRAFLRAAETIDDPLRVLDEARRGTLTADHTKALRAVYPGLHAQLTQTIVEEIADRGEALPYESRLTVSLLLDVPTDPSLTPGYIAAAQATHAGLPDAQQQEQAMNRRPPDISGAYGSAQERLARRAS